MSGTENTLHKILKSHREQKRFSLHSIHQETRIPVVFLEAMEAGNWKAFPAEVYLLGFLQKYSKYLGLDPNEMVQLYRQEQEAHDSVRQEQVKKVEQVAHREQSDSFVKGIVLAILILFVGVWWIYTVLEPSAKKEKRPAARASAEAPQALQADDSKLHLAVQAVENVWVRVVSDQSLQFEGFLPAGTTRQYSAEQDIQLRIGNVHALSLTLNDRKIDPRIGAVQGVGEFRFTRASLTDDSLLYREPQASSPSVPRQDPANDSTAH